MNVYRYFSLFSLKRINIIMDWIDELRPIKRIRLSSRDEAIDGLYSNSIDDISHNRLHIPSYFDINEIDWLYISDYLSIEKKVVLCWISVSSNGISWEFTFNGIKLQWVMILHQLDTPIQQIIIGMVQEGILDLIYYEELHEL